MRPLIFPLLYALLISDSAIALARLPNFIIIFTDDQGYQDLGCFGSPNIRTPHLDKLASEGLRLTSFYAQPICGPSRTALMTGCYPLRVAESENRKRVHPVVHSEEITLAEVLRKTGYATACIGKWDMAGHSNVDYLSEILPGGQGFDLHFGPPSSNDSRKQTVLLRNGKVVESPPDFSTLTEKYTTEAMQFIEAHQDQPFFLYLPHTMPHTELDASERFKGKSPRGLYGDVIEEIDDSVGRIVELLAKLDLAEETYLLFASDNGPWLIKNKDFRQGVGFEDHGGSALPLRSGKVSTWEGGVRVPAIIWAPGRAPAGTTTGAIVRTLDVLPTFAALAETEPPADRTIDGRDVSDLIHGAPGAVSPSNQYFYYLHTHLQAVRAGRWKLHLPRESRPPWLERLRPEAHVHADDVLAIREPLLFDLESDISEQHDLADQYPQVVRRLLALAEQARHDIGDHDRVGRNARFFDPGKHRPELQIN